MDNQYGNENEEQEKNTGGDNFYSYHQQDTTGNSYQTYGYQGNSQNGTCQGGTYQNGTYQNGTYQNGAYQNATYQNTAYQKASRKEKKKREKKPGGFGMKMAKCTALALVFGLVAGVVFEGVHYVSGELFGNGSSQVDASDRVLTQNNGEENVRATATSSTYVAMDVSDIVEEVMPSIVAITNVSQTEYQSFWGGMPMTYESTSCGSGIIVGQDDENLYIATNNHVVNGASSLTVLFDDNSTVSAEVKGTEPTMDLAVVKVDLGSVEQSTMDHIRVATLGESDKLRVGEASIAIGNALGYGQSVTTGCISALNREVAVSDSQSNTNYTAELIQTDAAINPGNSGGALLNAVGEVIGINSVKYSNTAVEGIGYAIPINTAAPIIEDLIKREKVDQSESAYFGIAGVDVTDDVSNTYDMPSGVYVAQVTSGSGAEKAGVLKGDIITKFDGNAIGSMKELSDRLQYYKAGDTIDVTIQRAESGQYVEQVISVTLGKKM